MYTISGKEIDLKELLTPEQIEEINNLFKKELNVSFIKLLEETRTFELDFESKFKLLCGGCLACHINNEVWLTDTKNVATIVHEFVHVVQHKRVGIVSLLKKKMTKIANMGVTNKHFWLYKIDFNEREARRIASMI